jgi:hypothetical protein
MVSPASGGSRKFISACFAYHIFTVATGHRGCTELPQITSKAVNAAESNQTGSNCAPGCIASRREGSAQRKVEAKQQSARRSVVGTCSLHPFSTYRQTSDELRTSKCDRGSMSLLAVSAVCEVP